MSACPQKQVAVHSTNFHLGTPCNSSLDAAPNLPGICEALKSVMMLQFLLEGQEEIGSPNLAAFLQQHKGKFAADFSVSADGGQDDEKQGILALGLRGASAFEVEVTTLKGDKHSGEPFDPSGARGSRLAGSLWKAMTRADKRQA